MFVEYDYWPLELTVHDETAFDKSNWQSNLIHIALLHTVGTYAIGNKTCNFEIFLELSQ